MKDYIYYFIYSYPNVSTRNEHTRCFPASFCLGVHFRVMNCTLGPNSGFLVIGLLLTCIPSRLVNKNWSITVVLKRNERDDNSKMEEDIQKDNLSYNESRIQQRSLHIAIFASCVTLSCKKISLLMSPPKQIKFNIQLSLYCWF